MIACKYEEIYPPSFKDLVYITDRAYMESEIQNMEMEILNGLGFSVSPPTAYEFLELFAKF